MYTKIHFDIFRSFFILLALSVPVFSEFRKDVFRSLNKNLIFAPLFINILKQVNVEMDFPLSAEGLIPQRHPIVLVDRLLDSNVEKSVSDFLIREDCVFVEDGRIVSAGLMENIAQTCALRIGYLNRGQKVRIGVVGAVKNFSVIQFPLVGATLTTTVKEVLYVEPALVVSAETRVGNDLVATCEMKVFLTDNEG